MNIPYRHLGEIAWGAQPPQNPAAPEPGIAQLWRVEVSGLAADAPRFAQTLPEAEQRQCGQIRDAARRTEFAVVRGALRHILSRQLACPPEAVEITHTKSGKPELSQKHGTRLRFSVSHAGGSALVATAQTPQLGTDMECTESGRDIAALMARISPDARATSLLSRADFYRLWTAKEALIKAFGGGVSQLLRPGYLQFTHTPDGAIAHAHSDTPLPETTQLWGLDLGKGCLATLAAAEPLEIRAFEYHP